MDGTNLPPSARKVALAVDRVGFPRPKVDRLVAQELPRCIVLARKRFMLATCDPGFTADCLLRYAEGQADYGYQYAWLDWGEQKFDEETSTEIMDAVIYPTMAEVVRLLSGRKN